MLENNAIKVAVVAAFLVGLSACSKDKPTSKASPTISAKLAQAAQCPQGVEGWWLASVNKDATQGFGIVKEADGILRFNIARFQELISVSGEAQKLTFKDPTFKDVIVEVTAHCENQVVLMTEKDGSGNVKDSEWRLNAADGTGSLTIKDNGETQVLPLKKLAAPQSVPSA